MIGHIVQREHKGGDVTLFASVEDSTANRGESEHTVNGSLAWLNSGETVSIDHVTEGPEPSPFKFILRMKGDYVPKGDRFTTDEKQALAWLRELAESAIPSIALVGAVVWARDWRSYGKRIDAAKSPSELWDITREIRVKREAEKEAHPLRYLLVPGAQPVGKQAVAAYRAAAAEVKAKAGEMAKDAALSSLGSWWDEIPLAYKIGVPAGVGGVYLLYRVAKQRAVASGLTADDEEDDG